MALTLPNGVRFTINGVWSSGRPVLTVWHAIVVSGGNRLLAVTDSANQLNLAWTTNVLPLVADNYSFETISYVDLSSEAGVTGDFDRGTAAPGAVSPSIESPSIGMAVTKNITDKGRNKRAGRLFLPGIQAAEIDENGVVTPAARTAAATALSNFMTQFNGYTGANVINQRLVVAHTPSEEVEETKTRKKPAKNGIMTSSDITGFTAGAELTGIRNRNATG